MRLYAVGLLFPQPFAGFLRLIRNLANKVDIYFSVYRFSRYSFRDYSLNGYGLNAHLQFTYLLPRSSCLIPQLSLHCLF